MVTSFECEIDDLDDSKSGYVHFLLLFRLIPLMLIIQK